MLIPVRFKSPRVYWLWYFLSAFYASEILKWMDLMPLPCVEKKNIFFNLTHNFCSIVLAVVSVCPALFQSDFLAYRPLLYFPSVFPFPSWTSARPWCCFPLGAASFTWLASAILPWIFLLVPWLCSLLLFLLIHLVSDIRICSSLRVCKALVTALVS